jgi:hypothetical protein
MALPVLPIVFDAFQAVKPVTIAAKISVARTPTV